MTEEKKSEYGATWMGLVVDKGCAQESSPVWNRRACAQGGTQTGNPFLERLLRRWDGIRESRG